MSGTGGSMMGNGSGAIARYAVAMKELKANADYMKALGGGQKPAGYAHFPIISDIIVPQKPSRLLRRNEDRREKDPLEYLVTSTPLPDASRPGYVTQTTLPTQTQPAQAYAQTYGLSSTSLPALPQTHYHTHYSNNE